MRKKRKNNNILKFLTIIIILIILGILYVRTLKSPVDKNDTSKIEVQIDDGTSSIKIAKILKSHNLIKNDKYFLYYAKTSNLGDLKSGVYEFSKSQSLYEILKSLNTGGRPIGEKVTIKEGYSIKQIADLLEEKGLVNKEFFIKLTENKANFSDKFTFLQDESIQSLEGFMYPETYFIPKGTPETEIISMFLSQTQKIFDENSVLSNINDINPNIQNLNNLITLASIVEKESADNSERDIIAGIFINRLTNSIPLQSCVTVEYVLGIHKQRLSYEDTQVQSPYNTYINAGLPPTPICTPTISSINAVKNYKRTDYLFFVAKQDGSHVFSRTYDEHLKATKDIYGEY